MKIYFLFLFYFLKINSFVFKKNIFSKQFLLKNNNNEIEKEKKYFYQFGKNPRLEMPNENGILTWYPIGFKYDFDKNPKRITIRDVNYIVWKNNSEYHALRDCCSHQGSSFALGNVFNNTISCPYHGYVFNASNGVLLDIPDLKYMSSHIYDIATFKVSEKGDVVYLNTIPCSSILNEKNKIDETEIFVEPEFSDINQKCVILKEEFEHYAKFVSVNSLDICHIGFVHTFGNNKNPNPRSHSNVIKMKDHPFHYKIIYQYLAGKNSLVNKIYNFTNILVENEYVLPHTTVARVKFGKYSSTIITHALPVSKFKTNLFVKAYRSYWSEQRSNPFYAIINFIGDKITKYTMIETLKQDKRIVDFIDKTNYQDMHGRFSIEFDMFSNHYKLNYKRFYEENSFTI